MSASIEDSAAHLYAATGAQRTSSAMLDRLLTGPQFLDAETHPGISLRSEMLVRVPKPEVGGAADEEHVRGRQVDSNPRSASSLRPSVGDPPV